MNPSCWSRPLLNAKTQQGVRSTGVSQMQGRLQGNGVGEPRSSVPQGETGGSGGRGHIHPSHRCGLLHTSPPRAGWDAFSHAVAHTGIGRGSAAAPSWPARPSPRVLGGKGQRIGVSSRHMQGSDAQENAPGLTPSLVYFVTQTP